MRESENEKEAVDVEVRIRHSCHEHELIRYDDHSKISEDKKKLLSKMAFKKCRACSKIKNAGESDYFCNQCDYILHKRCAELPREFHSPFHIEHPLTLLHKLPYPARCNICEESISGFTYHCEVCEFDLDIKCSSKEPKNLDKEKRKRWEIQHCAHKHPLIPKIFSEVEGHNRKCKCCKLSTVGLGYHCPESSCWCAFHISCAQASRKTPQEHPFHPSHHLNVLKESPYPFGEMIWCGACGKSVEGIFLHCAEPDCEFDLHIKCSQLPPVVKHYRHEHLLSFFEELNPDYEFPCITCDGQCVTQSYRCVPCDFNIHSGCVNLPEIVKSKHHLDPLTLKNKYVEEGVLYGDYYCDACEQLRDIEHGIYLCADCEYITHIDCALAEVEYTIPEIVSTFHDKVEEKEGQKEGDTSATTIQKIEDKWVAEIIAAIDPTTEMNRSREYPNEEIANLRAEIREYAGEEIANLRSEIEAMTTKIMAELGLVMKKLRELEIKYAK